jgi:circadian clock protein KaiB
VEGCSAAHANWFMHAELLVCARNVADDSGQVVSQCGAHVDHEQREAEWRPPTTYVLKLYVTGSSPRAQLAIANLRRICEQELRGQYQLEIIDVLERPQVAEDDKILATPTLIKQLPPPLRRVIGDLSDKEKVLLGLEVRRDATNSDSPHDVS